MARKSVLNTQMARKSVSNAQRKALRAWYQDANSTFGSIKTLADTSTWWNDQYGYPLSSSTASDILSSKYTFLDTDDSKIQGDLKRKRGAKWKVLEEALSEWALQFESVHGVVSGDLLRLKATEFWTRLDEY